MNKQTSQSNSFKRFPTHLNYKISFMSLSRIKYVVIFTRISNFYIYIYIYISVSDVITY